MKTNVHDNSVKGYHESIDELHGRARDIYHKLCFFGVPMTARELRDRCYPDQDMNYVRPRLTELKEQLWVIEFENVEDDLTGKTVAAYKAVSAEKRAQIIEDRLRNAAQMEMFA
jgi:hypothetical protein